MSHLSTLLVVAAVVLGLLFVVLGLAIGFRNGLRIRLRRGGTSARSRFRGA